MISESTGRYSESLVNGKFVDCTVPPMTALPISGSASERTLSN